MRPPYNPTRMPWSARTRADRRSWGPRIMSRWPHTKSVGRPRFSVLSRARSRYGRTGASNIVHVPPSAGENYDFYSPTHRAKLQDIVRRASAAGATVRVSGQRHSQLCSRNVGKHGRRDHGIAAGSPGPRLAGLARCHCAGQEVQKAIDTRSTPDRHLCARSLHLSWRMEQDSGRKDCRRTVRGTFSVRHHSDRDLVR